jgi:hypothetical protein
MAVKNDPEKGKVPALSELVGEIIPMPWLFDGKGKPVVYAGLKLWRRPYADGVTEDVVIVSTEVACQLFEVSATTLSVWSKETVGLRVAFGWFNMPALIQRIADGKSTDQRGRR